MASTRRVVARPQPCSAAARPRRVDRVTAPLAAVATVPSAARRRPRPRLPRSRPSWPASPRAASSWPSSTTRPRSTSQQQQAALTPAQPGRRRCAGQPGPRAAARWPTRWPRSTRAARSAAPPPCWPATPTAGLPADRADHGPAAPQHQSQIATMARPTPSRATPPAPRPGRRVARPRPDEEGRARQAQARRCEPRSASTRPARHTLTAAARPPTATPVTPARRRCGQPGLDHGHRPESTAEGPGDSGGHLRAGPARQAVRRGAPAARTPSTAPA